MVGDGEEIEVMRVDGEAVKVIRVDGEIVKVVREDGEVVEVERWGSRIVPKGCGQGCARVFTWVFGGLWALLTLAAVVCDW